MTNHALYYFEDVAKHNTRGDCWVTISAKVYDVSSFLEDHPGGDEVLLAAAGKDATADFEDVGHSDDALGLMKRYYIGEVDKFTLPVKQKDSYKGTSGGNQSSGSGAGFVKMLQFLLPLLILGFALALRHYKNKE